MYRLYVSLYLARFLAFPHILANQQSSLYDLQSDFLDQKE